MALTISGSGGGIPTDTLVLETGSYVGTGQSGSSNPNSITFTNDPVLIYIRDATTTADWAIMQVMHLTSSYSTVGTTFYSQNYAKYENHVLSWYTYNTSTSRASVQRNTSGTTYEWFAICKK